jgi:hypothetical protein
MTRDRGLLSGKDMTMAFCCKMMLALPLIVLMTWRSARTEEDAGIYVVTNEALRPTGEYFERRVPATLDLAERGRLAVRGLIHMLNDKDLYSPFEHAFFNTDPPYMSRDPANILISSDRAFRTCLPGHGSTVSLRWFEH